VLAAGAALAYVRFLSPPRRSLLVADAFGPALFTFVGARIAHEAGVAPPIVVLMETITGVAGDHARRALHGGAPDPAPRDLAIDGALVFVVPTDLGVPGPCTKAPASPDEGR